MLEGKKTYITAILTVLFAIVAIALGKMDYNIGVPLIVNAIALGFFRKDISEKLSAPLSILQGKKTYLAGGITALFGLLGVVTGRMDYTQAMPAILNGLGLIFLRSGITKRIP